MIVSSEGVRKFLFDLLNQASFPGNMVEFVSAVKREVAEAKIDLPENVSEMDGTASARMMSHKAK